jgi:flagellar basal-body rod modification protein FlgD
MTTVDTSTASGSNAAVLNKINNANSASQAQLASQSAAGGSKSGDSTKALNTTFNTFLTMLTTQLKNQDPLSPSDSTQFTNQLVQFSEVEQQINSNSNLQQLITLQKTSQQASALGYIGQTVQSAGSDLPLQNGNSYFTYTLPADSTATAITIKDSTGTTVASVTAVDGTAGTHKMSWNGANLSGGTSPDGKYTLSITAAGADGKAIVSTINTYGKVTGVTSDANGTELSLGAVTLPLANVQSIVDPASLSSKTTTN